MVTESPRSDRKITGTSEAKRVSADQAFVYVLRCADGSLYTGWTVDIERRLAAHRAGKASRYTRSRLPVELAASWSLAGRSEALREEARIKSLPRAEKLRLLGAAGSPAMPRA